MIDRFRNKETRGIWESRLIGLILLVVLSYLGALADDVRAEDGVVIRIRGSETMIPLLNIWSAQYSKVKPNVILQIDGGGSLSGAESLARGDVDLSASSRPLKPAQIKALFQATRSLGQGVLCARDALVIYLNPKNPVRNLSRRQLRDILNGTLTNWKELGGLDHKINIVHRSENSGSAKFLRQWALKDESFAAARSRYKNIEDVIQKVEHDPGALGYGGLGFGETLTHCRIDNIEPVEDNVRSGAYPLSRYLYLYSAGKPEGELRDFIDWILDEGQQHVTSSGFIPLWKE